jgi:hypothetical protein
MPLLLALVLRACMLFGLVACVYLLCMCVLIGMFRCCFDHRVVVRSKRDRSRNQANSRSTTRRSSPNTVQRRYRNDRASASHSTAKLRASHGLSGSTLCLQPRHLQPTTTTTVHCRSHWNRTTALLRTTCSSSCVSATRRLSRLAAAGLPTKRSAGWRLRTQQRCSSCIPTHRSAAATTRSSYRPHCATSTCTWRRYKRCKR